MNDDTVEALVTLGLARDEAERAVAEDRVALALVSPLLEDDRTVTTEEAAQRLRLPVEYLLARDRALGLPDDIGYSEAEVDELQPLGELLQLLSAEGSCATCVPTRKRSRELR